MNRFKPVELGDAPALQRLMETNAGYTFRISGSEVEPRAALDALTALPPLVSAEQKCGFGLWDGELLLAFCDVIIGWPEPCTAHIGLLMTDSHRPRQGLGCELHEAMVSELLKIDVLRNLRLAIVETNAAAGEPFWKSLGYRPTGETAAYRSGSVESRSRIWCRTLRGKAGPKRYPGSE
ncbi:GNAT family N-acetyltransferase [Glutamicibacter mishrai]|uniref:GNAT family N-acetyltransferase n=1 Tax=Glutamicibacter mishrai TaxID=1775880 RepID=UPI0020CD7ABC|nr:GNAT family N-acetyltransferase [Glutamicibacter mishrai]UTT38625.1 GNAT family N-acetyltransferase [Glutamicibacter mishrai]